MSRCKLILPGLILSLFMHSVSAREQFPPEVPDLTKMSIDMQWFLSYLNGEDKGATINEFTLKRGYVNIKKRINETFSGRITTDLTVDQEGDGEGDVEVRLKYLYLKYQLPSLGIFHQPYMEFGLAHRPWIDFEQHINLYRVQGTMFLERNDVINSGDNGIYFMSLLGDEMDADYQRNVNNSYAGSYGSIAFGIFNGGGYHALEKNTNKSLESRISIRPFHEKLPGLQLTYHNAFGKGNIAKAPYWTYHSGYLSYESKNLVLTSEYYTGEGNYKGSAIQDTVSFEAVPQNGYSIFGEWKLFNRKLSLVGRYDYFAQQYDDAERITRRSVTGIAFHFIRGSKIFINYDLVDHSENSSKNSHIFEVAVELKY